MNLIKPKEVTLKDEDGNVHEFIISKIPAVEGRELACVYPISAIPKIGDYKKNEEMMYKLISYAAVVKEGQQIQLLTKSLINNHVSDFEMLLKLEALILDYNCSFFRGGRASTSLSDLIQKFAVWASKMLIQSSGQSSQTEKPPSTN